MPKRRVIASCAAALCLAALCLGACATTPSGPAILALPAPGTPFGKFQADDTACRGYATGLTSNGTAAANDRAIGVLVLGGALGAAAGGGIGSAFGHAGTGALVGVGSGLDLVSSYALERDRDDAGSIQHAYDNAYAQCMFANGNLVPGHGPPPRAAGVPANGVPNP